jgi:hypothetical protein
MLEWLHIIIDSEHFDALLCALHMTKAGDGFSIVSALRPNSDAVTLMFTGYPELEHAAVMAMEECRAKTQQR